MLFKLLEHIVCRFTTQGQMLQLLEITRKRLLLKTERFILRTIELVECPKRLGQLDSNITHENTGTLELTLITSLTFTWIQIQTEEQKKRLQTS